MKHYISYLFIVFNLFIAVVQAAEWEMQYRSAVDFQAVWGSASNDVFAVGYGAIFHYDGSRWNEMDTETYYNLTGIWGSSSNDVFAVGATISGEQGVILHYDGNQWTLMNSGTHSYLDHIWGSSSTDVFTIGENGTILHYDGSNWMSMNSGTNSWLYRIWGSSSTDVFAVGGDTILHYDGNQWTPMNTGTNFSFNSIWGSSSTDVFATGWDNNGSGQNILHYDGNQWMPVNLGINFVDIRSIWGSSSTDVFATGWDNNGNGQTILHYDGNQWTPMNTGTNFSSNSIWGSSSTDVFAVGWDGNIFHYDGNQWMPMNIGTNSYYFYSIWGSSSTDVFAGGWNNGNGQNILHYDGNQWTPMNLGTNYYDIHSIWGSSSTDVFAFGWNTVLHYDGSTWMEIAKNIASHYYDYGNKIWGSSENDVFVITGHAILHYGGCTNCNQKDFKVNPRSHNFWNVAIGNQASKTFTVSNTSNNEIQLQNLILANNTTEFTLNNDACSNALLTPAGTCQVTVDFQPQTEGTKLTKVTIPSNLETIEVPISGTGCSTTFQQQAFYLYPESPNFGATLVGNPLTLNQTVSFTATQGCGEPLYIDKIEVVGQDAAEFEVKDIQCYSSSYGKESYSYCQFNTIFNSTTAGEKQAELTFQILDHEELPMPTVALQAKAVDAGQAQLDLTPSEHDFGTVVIGRSSSEPLSLVVTNLGEISMSIDNITLTGDNAADFSLESWSCSNIGILYPQAQCYINVGFNPTAVGQKQAYVIVTAGDLNPKTLLTGVAEEPKDCSDTNITIKSVQSGRWDDANTWSTATVPVATDVVRINTGHTVTGQEFSQIKTLCVQANATLESLDDQGTALEIQATDYLENHGTIRGKDGNNETQSTCSQEQIGTEGCAQPGASVLLKVGTGFDKYGKLGDWWWEGSGGPILNQGEIIAGKGGDGSQYGAHGGDAIVLGRNTTNANRIQAGDGGNVLGTETGQGGRGGLTQIWGKLGGPGNLFVQNGAQALAGKGGSCHSQGQQTGGDGGNLWLVSLPDVYIEGGITEAGSGGQGCATPGQDGWVRIEPNVISLAGAATHVKGGDIAIYGGDNWTLDLSNLSGNVIEASGNLTLAVGKGGIIDFRGTEGQILTAKAVQIFTDNLQIDSGKPLSDYIKAENIVVGPSKIIRDVSLSVANKLFGNPGEVISIPLIIANNGPETDQYTLTVKDAAGNILSQLAAVEVKGLETVNLAIDITIPTNNKVIFTAVSQADPDVSATSEVILTTKPVISDSNPVSPPANDDSQIPAAEANQPVSDDNQILPPEEANQLDSQISLEEPNQLANDDNQATTTEGNQFEPENHEEILISNNDVVVVEQPTINICHVTSDGIIDWACINKEQILTDVIFESNAKVSGGQLAGTIDNQGLVSQVIIQPDTVLTGGKLSGYIVNHGTLMDFEFVGAQVIGGTLAGQVINNSLIGGVFKDVNLAADAHLIGGYLQGQIQGDPAAPALLEEVAIQAGSHLAYVKIGKKVTWSADVVFEGNVEFIEPTTYCNLTQLAEIVPLLPSLDPMVPGNLTPPCTQLVGGLSTDGKPFQRQLTVTLADKVEVLARIAPDLRHVNQTVDLVLSIAYRSLATDLPQYFMIDNQGRVLPWDGDISHLVALQEHVKLDLVQSLSLYHDKIPAMGLVAIQFGYRLVDGTVVLNEQPLEIKVVELN